MTVLRFDIGLKNEIAESGAPVFENTAAPGNMKHVVSNLPFRFTSFWPFWVLNQFPAPKVDFQKAGSNQDLFEGNPSIKCNWPRRLGAKNYNASLFEMSFFPIQDQFSWPGNIEV